MLLEAWRIAQALKDAGIDIAGRCADVATPGRTGGPVLRLLIGADGQAEIVPVLDDELASLWSFRKANFHYWPVVRPNGPLCSDAAVAHEWRSKLAKAKQLPSMTDRRVAVAKVLSEGVLASEFSLQPLRESEAKARNAHRGKYRKHYELPRDVRILRWRIWRYLRTAEAFESFSDSLHETIFALLYGKVNNGQVRGDGLIAFDLKEGTIYSPQTRQAVETSLSVITNQSASTVVCGLTGLQGRPHEGKFPNPTLPIVANSGIAMFSMFREAPANFRYGRADDKIVRVTCETVSKAHDALVHVTSKENFRSYWLGFPNGKTKDRRDQSDLLIAYAQGVEVACAYGDDEEDDPDGPTYEEAIAPVLEALDGKAKLTPRATVLLVLLRQISNAQVQAVYCRTPLASDVLNSGRRWIVAQKARPELLCAAARDRLISPAQVVRLLSKQWAGNPPKPSKLNGPSSADALDFMLALGEDRDRRANELLHTLLQRSSTLLMHVGAELRRNPDRKVTTKEEGKGLRADADRLCRLFALILDAKERTLEDTSRSPAYLLGLLLGLVDTLHWAYCTKVRKDVPPSLGGSQLLGIASEDPTRALGDLLERIRPWHDWADTAQPKDDDITTLRAKKALARLSSVAPELAGRLPGRLDDTGKAELLLGFLSRDTVADQYKPTQPNTD